LYFVVFAFVRSCLNPLSAPNNGHVRHENTFHVTCLQKRNHKWGVKLKW